MTKKKYPRPIHGRVLIKPDVAVKESGGILIPDTAIQSPSTGEVVGIGEKVTGVAVGDKVKFSQDSGTQLEFEDETLLIMEDVQILVIY